MARPQTSSAWRAMRVGPVSFYKHKDTKGPGSFWRDNGLTIVSVGLFLLFWVLQTLTGWLQNNQENLAHHQQALGYLAYLASPGNLEATMENWESEFLQMGLFVVLTGVLYQRGSAESNDPDEGTRSETSDGPGERPLPVRRGGLIRKLYEHSLSIALFTLFGLAFALHAVGGLGEYNQTQIMHGEAPTTFAHFLTLPQFWFQSFQNWQSEFLAVASLTFLSIYLREKGSAQSKAVESPHDQTGE